MGHHLPIVVQHVAKISIINMRDDITRLHDVEADDIRSRMVFLNPVFADMEIKRNADQFGNALAHVKRYGPHQAIGAGLEIADETRMVRHPILPAGDRDGVETANLILDIAQSDDAEGMEVGPRIEAGNRLPAAQQSIEFVEGADTRPAGIDHRGDALIDADAVGVAKSQRAISVDMQIDPTGTDIETAKIDYLTIAGRNLADRLDLAIGNADVGNPVDALARVDHMTAL